MNLIVICPGLFGPIDQVADGLPPTPVLDRLLGRASGGFTAPRDVLETLAESFGLTARPGSDLPSAPLCLLADAPSLDPSGCWFHADPVHLHPDRDRLLLFAGPALRVRRDESAALADAFNAHFAPNGLELAVPRPDRWYLRAGARSDLRTRPLHAVAGQPVDAFLPIGPDARDWIRWQTEAQMLFHAHPVNAARERAGQPALGGLWTWGGGELPRVTGGPGLVIADHPLAAGLARAAGTRPLELAAWDTAAADWPRASTVLVFWDRSWWPALDGGGASWQETVVAFEAQVKRLLVGFQAGLIESLTIDDGSRVRFNLTRGALRCFWRRRGGFSDWLAQSGQGAGVQ